MVKKDPYVQAFIYIFYTELFFPEGENSLIYLNK